MARRAGLRGEDDPRRDERELQEGPGEGHRQPWPGKEGAMRPAADHGEESYRGSGRLEGKRALVTGGDSGIGRAVALAFAREGADVAIAYVSEEEDARETLRWIEDAGRDGHSFRVDVSGREACEGLVRDAAEALGGLDIVVNNAAYQCEVDDFLDVSPEQVERTFRTNILAYIWIAREALRHLGEGGVILNTGSVTAMDGHASLVDYASTKGAIHTFTKSLAQAVADRGIRVNCVAPGPVWTPLIPATLDEEHVERFGADTLWGRAAQPIEVATSYVFLASDDGRYYTGEVLAPTGRAASR